MPAAAEMASRSSSPCSLLPPPLASVLAVLRQNADVTALPHVVTLINECLDHGLPRFWSLRRACEANLLLLLPRLMSRGVLTGVDPHFWSYQCRLELVCTVKNDNLEIVKWLHKICPSVLPYLAMVEAAKIGNLLTGCSDVHRSSRSSAMAARPPKDLRGLSHHEGIRICSAEWPYDAVKWFHEHYGDAAQALFKDALVAVHSSHSEVTKFLFEHPQHSKYPMANAIAFAAKKGDLEQLQWFLFKSPLAMAINRNLKIIDDAATEGHLHIVQWLHDHYSDSCTSSAMEKAASHGALEVVQWLHENRSEGCMSEAMNAAAKCGHLDIVKWLHENRSEECPGAIQLVAVNGHFEVLLFLQANRNEGCGPDTFVQANECVMHLEIVQWLLEKYPEAVNVEQVLSNWSYMKPVFDHILRETTL